MGTNSPTGFRFDHFRTTRGHRVAFLRNRQNIHSGPGPISSNRVSLGPQTTVDGKTGEKGRDRRGYTRDGPGKGPFPHSSTGARPEVRELCGNGRRPSAVPGPKDVVPPRSVGE